MIDAIEYLNKHIGTFKHQLDTQPYLEKSIIKAINEARADALREAAEEAKVKFSYTAYSHEVDKESILSLIPKLK